jgi:hypothetical protein
MIDPAALKDWERDLLGREVEFQRHSEQLQLALNDAHYQAEATATEERRLAAEEAALTAREAALV